MYIHLDLSGVMFEWVDSVSYSQLRYGLCEIVSWFIDLLVFIYYIYIYMLFSYILVHIFFRGHIRSDDQPPVPHIVSIFSIQRDPVFPSWFALCLQTSILWCYCCMTSLVFHVFASHSISPGSHTSPARTRRLWWCVQRRRVCDVQQIPRSCLVMPSSARILSSIEHSFLGHSNFSSYFV